MKCGEERGGRNSEANKSGFKHHRIQQMSSSILPNSAIAKADEHTKPPHHPNHQAASNVHSVLQPVWCSQHCAAPLYIPDATSQALEIFGNKINGLAEHNYEGGSARLKYGLQRKHKTQNNLATFPTFLSRLQLFGPEQPSTSNQSPRKRE